MQRRRLLAAMGTSSAATLTGCLGAFDGFGSPDGRRTFPTLSVEADPAPAPATVDVSVVRGFDAEGPARLEIACTNGGDDEFSALFGSIPPFTNLYGEKVGGEADLLLVPLDRPYKRRVIPPSPANDTWLATGDVAVNATATIVPLAPGETLSRTYALLAAPGNDDLAAGEYRFEATDYLGNGSWGFTVLVSY